MSKLRLAFEVPMIERDGCRQGRLPKRYGASYYYTKSGRCAVVVTESGAKYLHQRKYARYIGLVNWHTNLMHQITDADLGDKDNG